MIFIQDEQLNIQTIYANSYTVISIQKDCIKIKSDAQFETVDISDETGEAEIHFGKEPNAIPID